jgi:hypothetical protein
MSEENVERLYEIQGAWNRGESATKSAEAYHPDVEFLPLRVATEGGYRGRSGVEAFIADMREVFEGSVRGPSPPVRRIPPVKRGILRGRCRRNVEIVRRSSRATSAAS